MTEYDRGAYTPQADAPLAFDARGPRDRRPMPMTLVASGVVLLVIVGALFLAYRGGVKGGAQAPRPVGEPIGAIKTAAAPGPAGAASADPVAGADLYAAQNVPDVKPTFAPPPEQPAARPAPQLRVETVAAPRVRIEPAETVAAAPSTPAATAIHAGAADHVAPAAARPIQTAALTPPAPRELRPATASASAPASAAASKGPAAAKATASKAVEIAAGGASAKVVDATPAAAAPGGSLVQIGAFSSKALADKGYADVAGLMSGAMGGKRQHVEPVAHGDKTVFRTTIGGFADHAAAKAFCASLSAKGHTCFVKG